MISATSNISPLARVSQAHLMASRAIVPLGISLARGYQARYLWGSLWASCLEPESQSDKRYRCRTRSKYRYSRALKRQLSWDNTLKSQGDSFFKTQLRHHTDRVKQVCYSTPLDIWSWQRRMEEIPSGSRSSSGQPVSAPRASTQSDYVIDPISNRKVPKNPSNVADPALHEDPSIWEDRRKKLESLYLDLETMNLGATKEAEPRVFHSDGPPPADELDEYRKVDIGIPSYNEELIHRVTDLPKEKPHGVPPELPQPATEAPEPPSEIKDELEQYRKVEINYPPSMNEELIHRVNDMPPEKPTTDKSPAEEAAKLAAFMDGELKYEDLDKYRSYMHPEAALDANSEQVQARSWPSRVRHLEQNSGGDTSSKVVENKAKTSAAPSGILSAQQTPTWTPPSSLRQQSFQTRANGIAKPKAAVLNYDPYSKEPTGLETSWARECVNDPKANKMYIRHYSVDGTASDPLIVSPNSFNAKAEKISKTHAKIDTNQAPQGAAVLILYKILAYDPTTQTISIAETSSGVPDSSTPLSPAEVMLRLSHPTKFFSHFKPLQDEGFEIVSGSGDILVFRKVMPKAPEPVSQKVNPIDMMGRYAVPDIGNFASPTGYVNYDYDPLEEDQGSAATSSCDSNKVTGHSASSGQAGTEAFAEKTNQPGRRNFVKKTATGAAWLAGAAYGVGAISEFANKSGEGAKKASRP